MLIHSICNLCFQPFNLVIEMSEIELIKQVSDEKGMTAPCPRLCGGRVNLVGSPSPETALNAVKMPMTVTGREFFKAVMGAGLPDEIPVSAEVVSGMLKSGKITNIKADQVDGAIYLHEIELDHSVILHLASGSRGATVLKVTKARKPDGQ